MVVEDETSERHAAGCFVDGIMKFVVDKNSLAIIGIHIFSHGASSIAGEAALILAKNLTLRDVEQTIHPHPTLTEAFGFLAMNMCMGN